MNEVEEIKQRLDLAEIIGAYLPLVKAGGANMKARCPFHHEKTPSFYVSRDKQMWHCFGCGEGGDIFTFVQKIEGLEFREALKLLADKAGVKLPEWQPEIASERERLLQALDLAARFYAALLRESQSSSGARDYLVKRGVSEEMIAAFRLGYAPNFWDSLLLALGKRGIKAEELAAAGLVVRRERGSGWYDRFRGRLIFPIADLYGRIIGVAGRVLDPDSKEAKYVNTPQTLLYNKSAALYGIDLARQAMRQSDSAVVVEGNMDVIACHQFGFKNTVASSGTALTADQLRIIGRYTQNIFLAFDADSAGAAAARRGIDLAVGSGFTVKIISLAAGEGKDPDECIRKNPEIWRRAVERAAHYLEYLIQATAAGANLSDPAAKKKAGGALLAEVNKIPDAIEQSHWLKRISELLAVPEAALGEQLAKLGSRVKSQLSNRQLPTANPQSPIANRQPPISRHRLLSESFLAMLLTHPTLVPAAAASVAAELLSGSDLRELYTEGITSYTQSGHFSPPEIFRGGAPAAACGQQNANLLRSILLRGERDDQHLTPSEAEAELRVIMDSLREVSRGERLGELQAAMREAERTDNRAAVEKLQKIVQELVNKPKS